VAALEHGARNADSLKAMFNRLNNNYPSLNPLALQVSVPEIPPTRVNVVEYDRLFLPGGDRREGSNSGMLPPVSFGQKHRPVL
jgi:hypothetical protein